MTTVSALPTAPAQVKGGGRTASTATEDFASTLAALVSGAVPLDDVAATAEAVATTSGPATAELLTDASAAVVLPHPGGVADAASGSGGSAAAPGSPVAAAPAVATAAPATAISASAGPAAAPSPVVTAAAHPPAADSRAAPSATAPAATPASVTAPPAAVTVASIVAPVPSGEVGTGHPATAPEASQDPPGVVLDTSGAADAAPVPGEDTRDGRPLVPPVAIAPTTEGSPATGSTAVEVPVMAATAEARPAAAPGAPAPTGAPTAAPPATQVVTQLAPVLEGPDGSYTMSLQLYPEELGAVQVEISLRGGEISLALHAADDVSKDVLRAALPQLREQLEATGLTATDVSVGDHEPRNPRDESAGPRRGGGRDASTADDDPAPAPAPDPDAALDLRM